MPQIAPNTWKVAEAFYWFRKFADGRVEYQYDPDDGHPTKWDDTKLIPWGHYRLDLKCGRQAEFAMVALDELDRVEFQIVGEIDRFGSIVSAIDAKFGSDWLRYYVRPLTEDDISDLVRVVRFGWLPMTPDLAAKIRAYGEIGAPVSVPPVSIEVRPGEVPIKYRDCEVIHGLLVTCKGCGFKFRALKTPETCPKCKAEAKWKPFNVAPAAWEDAVYAIGIEGRYLVKITPHGIIVE